MLISPYFIHLVLKLLYGGKKSFFSYGCVLSVNISELKLGVYHTWTLDVDLSLHFHGDI